MAQLARRPNRPVRVGQGRAAQHHQVDEFLADDAVRILRYAQVPARRHGNLHLGADAVRPLNHEAHVIHRRVDHVVRVEAQRQVRQVQAVLFHHFDGRHGIVKLGACRMQVVRAQAHRQRILFRPYRAHGVQRLAMKPGAVRHAAAVLVGALIGQGREKTGPQVAVRVVHLQPFVARVQRTPGGVRIGFVQPLDLLYRERVDRENVATAAIRNGGRGDTGPAIGVLGWQLLAGAGGGGAAVRRDFTALAAGVAKLDGGHRAHALNDGDDPGVAFNLLVVPDAGAGCRGAAIGGDGHLLPKHQGKAAGRTGAEVAHVVIVQLAVDRVVHRHGGHHGPVAQGHALEGVWAEKIGHGCLSKSLKKGGSGTAATMPQLCLNTRVRTVKRALDLGCQRSRVRCFCRAKIRSMLPFHGQGLGEICDRPPRWR